MAWPALAAPTAAATRAAPPTIDVREKPRPRPREVRVDDVRAGFLTARRRPGVGSPAEPAAGARVGSPESWVRRVAGARRALRLSARCDDTRPVPSDEGFTAVLGCTRGCTRGAGAGGCGHRCTKVRG